MIREKSIVKNSWLWCFILGLAVLVYGQFLTSIFPTDSANYQPGYGAPILALEFARTPADLEALLGGASDPQREHRIAAMDKGQKLDFLFAVLYSSFLAWFFIAAKRAGASFNSRLLVGLCILAGSADIVENIILLDITADIVKPRWLAYLAYPVNLKFICLAVTGVMAGVLLFREVQLNHNKRAWKVLAVAIMLSPLFILAGLINPAEFGSALILALSVCWPGILLYAGVQAFANSWIKINKN